MRLSRQVGTKWWMTPINTNRYVVRNTQGETWAGPERWQGLTFTCRQDFWEMYGTPVFAENAIKDYGLRDMGGRKCRGATIISVVKIV